MGEVLARHTGGWVKFWRKAALGDINSNFTRGGLFGALIAMANLQESTVDWGGKPRTLNRGELVTSIIELAGIGETDRRTIDRHLNYLRLRGTLILEKRPFGTFIKIVNFAEYQDVDADSAKPQRSDTLNDRYNDSAHIEELKKKRIKEERVKSAPPMPPLALIWNEHCGDLANVVKTNKARNQKASLRWSENSPEEWVAIVKRVTQSDFCRGTNDRGWKATFDWLIQAETHLKIAEGKYDNGDGTTTGHAPMSIERARELLEGG